MILMLMANTAFAYWHPWICLRTDSSHECTPMGILLFDFDRRCLEFRSSPGEGQFTPLVRRQKDSADVKF